MGGGSSLGADGMGEREGLGGGFYRRVGTAGMESKCGGAVESVDLESFPWLVRARW